MYVGSLLRYFNVAVIPGSWTRESVDDCRFGTLVPGAEGRSPCGLGTFPALQILRSATADVPQVALSESSGTCRAQGVRCSYQMSRRINMTSGGKVL